MDKKPKLHRAWAILVSMVLVYAGATGVIQNCTGVLFAAIRTDRGFRAGDLSLFYTIRSLASAVAMPFTVKLFFSTSPRVVMSILGTLACGGMAAMCFFDQLWQWYVAAVFVGIGISCIFAVVPIVINNWFHKSNGLAIGLAMAGSGVGGAIFSPILSRLIVDAGWRQASLIFGLVGFLLIVPPSLLLLVSSPGKVGLLPYGEGESAKGSSPIRPGPASRPSPAIFALCLFVIISANGVVAFANQLPTFAGTVGHSIEVGALLTSCCMVGNLSGKLLFGILSDRVGVYHSTRAYVLTVCAALLGFLFLNGTYLALCASAVLFGACYSVSIMTPSLLLLDLYGQERYQDYLSRALAVNSFAAAFLTAAIPYLYDATGSFDLAFYIFLAVLLLSLAIFVFLQRYSRRRALD